MPDEHCAVGSGQAMAMGEKGEADVLLVHSSEAEKQFMAKADIGKLSELTYWRGT
jgi:ABC-type tungstate transport system permease subunit